MSPYLIHYQESLSDNNHFGVEVSFSIKRNLDSVCAARNQSDSSPRPSRRCGPVVPSLASVQTGPWSVSACVCPKHTNTEPAPPLTSQGGGSRQRQSSWDLQGAPGAGAQHLPTQSSQLRALSAGGRLVPTKPEATWLWPQGTGGHGARALHNGAAERDPRVRLSPARRHVTVLIKMQVQT